ncbi:endonuclease/exonuclease/phosphatase family protein [Micromonospora endolithica]|uniref:Endonuclease/exonuclease/phosphatase family protein n=1 Tax=Micromonospora endolithica TaxID=230091 RepID=A0A3A9ZHE1_9ACTN|nr:endonuclease/exonuclease/phosphatase family protein [Micromonospora endolithica]RKN47768.1 endonuclease/exonuclease/phosphatase family protein [Micromonospora endolithica]TWJ21444.1 Endonuclease/Exonuclease/phosphatase family protein [Micromonospora endolithica]
MTRRAARPARRRHLRWVLAAGCLLVAAALPAGSPAVGDGQPGPLRMLQMNLCNSGLAGCYTGRAVDRAGEVIRAEAPHLVTLNEICREDIGPLERDLADVHHGGAVVASFQAASDRRTGGPSRCRNGQEYGIGLLAHLPSGQRGHTTYRGLFPAQDPIDPEERAWLCLHAPGAFHACTTHLAAFDSAAALAQCVHLFGTAIPALHSATRRQPTLVGGDLNLRFGGTPDLRDCVPPDYQRLDGTGVQQILTTADVSVGPVRRIDMAGTTDHPGVLVSLTVNRPPDRST